MNSLNEVAVVALHGSYAGYRREFAQSQRVGGLTGGAIRSRDFEPQFRLTALLV
jgi:hypothetical protein